MTRGVSRVCGHGTKVREGLDNRGLGLAGMRRFTGRQSTLRPPSSQQRFRKESVCEKSKQHWIDALACLCVVGKMPSAQFFCRGFLRKNRSFQGNYVDFLLALVDSMLKLF